MAASTTITLSARPFCDREYTCTKVLRWIAAFVAMGLIGHLAVMLWAQHEFTAVEPLVVIHGNMLAHGWGFYYDLNHYPFTVSPYGPIFYAASGYLHKWGMRPYLSGRILSFAALLTAFWLCWKGLGYLTRDRYARAAVRDSGGIHFEPAVLGNGRADGHLAVCFSLGAFTAFLRYREWLETRALVWSGVLVVLAVFTKQTALAAGFAIGLTLLFEDRKCAAWWIAGVGIAGGGIALALNAITHGRYFSDAIFANMNPFAWFKLQQHAQYMVLTCGGIIVTAVVGARYASRRARPLYVYAGFATIIWLLTAPKLGSDLNYQMETMLALSMCAACALAELQFFPSLFDARRTWVTLLQVPLLLHVVLNVLLTARVLAERVLFEPLRAQETAALKPFVDRPGRLLSVHFDSMVHYRGRIEVEPLIYSLLVEAGRSDPGPVLRDLSDAKVRYDSPNRKPVRTCGWRTGSRNSASASRPNGCHSPELPRGSTRGGSLWGIRL